MQEKKQTKNCKIRKVTIIGVIPSFAFQRAKYCALELHKKLPQKFPLPEIIGMLELDWSEKLAEWRQTLGREYWCLRRPVAVFFDGTFIGSDIELLKLTSIGNVLFDNVPRKDMSCLKNNFRKDYIAFLKKSKRIYCYLDICVDEVYFGTLTFELYSDLLPRTCENFKTLCLGNKGSFLTYKGSRIHRIVKKGWLQGGDIQYKTGGGGFSIFCDPLEDEGYVVSHDRKGVLSMASGGRHKNGSQFFITLNPTEWMNTNFVAFGQLIEGSKVLKRLENLDTIYECPKNKIEIRSCGKLDLEDVEDVDAAYREEILPKKKPRKFETISEQIIRLIMEALTDALARKEYNPDVLDERDIASKMNIQLYFQGLYSIPDEIVQESARYFRNFRRVLLRLVKPSATEIVEVIMYDLLMAILTRMTTLDDIRETVGHELYEKMIGGIDMTLEMCKKSYVKRLVDQIANTAESMVTLITKKLQYMKKKSGNFKTFQERMQAWVQSFVIQETFFGDPYHIAIKRSQEPPKPEEPKKYPFRPGFPVPCCEKPREGDSVENLDPEKKEKLEKLKAVIPAADFCCLGTKLLSSDIALDKFFSLCPYDLKRKPEDVKARLPLLDLIEISRYRLRFLRRQENRMRTPERLCLEKKIRKWMEDVKYTPETCWIRDTVFEPDEVAIDHIEDIMYGAMTVGLLEMYYFYEQYLKRCGATNKTRKTSSLSQEFLEDSGGESIHSHEEVVEKIEKTKKPKSETSIKEEIKVEVDHYDMEIYGEETFFDKEEFGEEDKEEDHGDKLKVEKQLPECKCGHPCCVCAFDPNYVLDQTEQTMEKKSDEGSGSLKSYGDRSGESFRGDREGEGGEGGEGEGEGGEKDLGPSQDEKTKKKKPCPPGTVLVDLNEILAETLSLKPAEIDITSFKWLKSYIIRKGCDLKTQFATQTHKWLEGDKFGYKGFFSKHSLVTRASLLSMSMSLAELIKEENKYKLEIRNFIYDLWDLYFNEMFNEALLEFPPVHYEDDDYQVNEEEEREMAEKERQRLKEMAESENKEEAELVEEELKKKGMAGKTKATIEDLCKDILERAPAFDLDAFCAKYDKEKRTRKESKSVYIEEHKEEYDRVSDTESTHKLDSLKDQEFHEKDNLPKSTEEQKESAPSSTKVDDRRASVASSKIDDRRFSSMSRFIEPGVRISLIPKKSELSAKTNVESKKSLHVGNFDTLGHKSYVSTREDYDRRKSVISAVLRPDRRKSGKGGDEKRKSLKGDEGRRDSRGGDERRGSKGGDERRGSKGGDERRGSKGGDEKRKSLKGDEGRRDSRGGDERRGSKGGNERRGSKGGDERRGSKGGDERRGSRGDEERRDSRGGEERRGSRVGEERRGSRGGEERKGSRGGEERRGSRGDDERKSLKGDDDRRSSKGGDKSRASSKGDDERKRSLKGGDEENINSFTEVDRHGKLASGIATGKLKREKSEKSQGKIFGSRTANENKYEYDKKSSSFDTTLDLTSNDSRSSSAPYTSPFWITFLTELTKQALGAMAKASVLPKRLYFKAEVDVDFDEKMKEWFEFNAFNPQPTKGRELIDYISLHHQSLTNLEESARSYLRKKKYSGLINRCTRFSSADDMANEILTDVVGSIMSNTEEEAETLELFLSNMIPTAIAAAPGASESYDSETEFETNSKDEILGESNS